MLPDHLAVRPGFRVPATELRWRYSRSSGPGGQSVNTSDTRVEVSFDVARSACVPEAMRQRALSRLDGLVDGVITVSAQEHRSQLRNREAAAARLAAVLREATAPPPRARRPTRPSAGSVERRIAAKRRRSQTKRLRRRGDDPD